MGPVPARGRCGTAAGRRTGLFAGAIDRDHDISERSETAIIVRTNRSTTAAEGPVPARGRCGTGRGGALGCLLAPLTAIMTFLNALKQPS